MDPGCIAFFLPTGFLLKSAEGTLMKDCYPKNTSFLNFLFWWLVAAAPLLAHATGAGRSLRSLLAHATSVFRYITAVARLE